MSDKIYYSNPGDPIIPIYTKKVNDDGTYDLVKTGEDNIQELIDSFAEETCIHSILARCSMGDTSALSKRQGTYGDFTEVPKTWREVLELSINGKDYFDHLPLEIKRQFNGFEDWIVNAGTESWFEIMKSLDGDVSNPVVDDEVIKE